MSPRRRKADADPLDDASLVLRLAQDAGEAQTALWEEREQRVAAEADTRGAKAGLEFLAHDLEQAEDGKRRRMKGLVARNQKVSLEAAARRAKWQAEILAASDKKIGRILKEHADRIAAAKRVAKAQSLDAEETRDLIKKAGLSRSTIFRIRAHE